MWQGKKKAITFSFDDGVTQDIRLIEILDRYGLKATFNLNSGGFGKKGNPWIVGEQYAERETVAAEQVKEIYKNHEVAVHTLTHPNLTLLDDEAVINEVETDRKNLEALVGYPIKAMAYPCGGVNNDDRVAKLIKENTPIRFARTITSTNAFAMQENLLRFNPTIYYRSAEKMFALAEEFLRMQTDKPQVFYIWGHAYELDGTEISWEKFEKLCRLIGGKEDIFYGTNSQIFLQS